MDDGADAVGADADMVDAATADMVDAPTVNVTAEDDRACVGRNPFTGDGSAARFGGGSCGERSSIARAM